MLPFAHLFIHPSFNSPFLPQGIICVARIPHPAWKWSKHLTYRHHGEDGIDHTCADSGIDRLLDTCIFEDSCRVVEHLTGNKRCNYEIQLWVAAALNPQKINSKVPEVQEFRPAICCCCSITVSFLQTNDLFKFIFFLVVFNSSYLVPFFPPPNYALSYCSI